MRDTFVAIDLETTGLSIESDAIIEVGIVRIKDGQILEEFSSLVNPGTDISPEISHLTGIYPEDVHDAPTINAVLPQIRDFVGNAPIIAHNVSFDLGFLRHHGILKSNPGIDTFDLATVLLPRATRYTLTNLTTYMDISLENAHRALDDARATALLYWKLWEKLIILPDYVVAELDRLSRAITDWDGARFFQAAARERNLEGRDIPLNVTGLFEPWHDEHAPLIMGTHPQHINIDNITETFSEHGTLAKALGRYEKRSEQVEMARSVAASFNNSRHMMIEADTGTGKSLAYLLPSVLWCISNQQRVVVATNTINLQDQLINKDIPLLQQVFDDSFRASVMKGRQNYLCPRRLSIMRMRQLTNVDEFRVLGRVFVWLNESKTGDRGELTLRGIRENMVWQRLSADDEDCSLHRCESIMKGSCPFYKARRTAESSNIVVVNHALLISDAMADSQVIPDYRYLVVDEAHQLEDTITNGLNYHLEASTLLRRLEDLGGVNHGLLGDLLNLARKHLSDKKVARLEAYAQHINQAAKAMRGNVKRLFDGLYEIVDESGALEENFRVQVRILAKHRDSALFGQLREIWRTLSEFFEVISDAMYHLSAALHKLSSGEIIGLTDVTNSTDAIALYLSQTRDRLNSFINQPDPNMIYWVTMGDFVREPVLNVAPLHVGPMMESYLWSAKESIILTSATIQTQGSFSYIRNRLYADNVDILDVGSPFNYRESTLVYIPTDMPEPNQYRDYQRAVERGIIELAAALEGRVMVLFTSYAQLRETAQNISSRLALGNIAVFDQVSGSSRENLLEEFKTTERAVLLGTRSFWQGVDIPGEQLSALVIVRLPFAVPNDPVFAARSDTYSNSFQEYSVPDAILRFRQGFGRLIRTQSDRGIVAIFDSRIISKKYGQHFLESLPDCEVIYRSLDYLAETATDWLVNRKN